MDGSINEKLDKMNNKLTEIQITQAAQHTTLKEHTRRSKASEDRLIVLEETRQQFVKHMAALNGAVELVKLVFLVAAAIGAVAGLTVLSPY